VHPVTDFELGLAQELVIRLGGQQFGNISDLAAGLRDSTMLHGLDPVVYLSGVTQLGVPSEDRTAGPMPWTTSHVSVA
jgi:hypothetical protein